MRNHGEIGERLPMLNIRFLPFAMNDHVCIIKITLNKKRKNVKLKKKGKKIERTISGIQLVIRQFVLHQGWVRWVGGSETHSD